MTHLEEYNKIIEFRKANPLSKEQYGEKHHIVPKKICPMLEHAQDNLVRLTAQEHFIVHYHLWKAYRDELHEKKWARKMCYAFHRMKQQLLKCDDIETMSKLYEEVRIEFSKVHSEALKGHRSWSKGKPSPWKGKHPSEESRKKMSDAHKGKIPANKGHRGQQVAWNKGKHGLQAGIKHPMFGKKHTVESCKKMSESHKGLQCYNNGIINIFAKECPDGFVNGRLKRSK